MVTESAAILKRFYFLERELIHLAAGWVPGTAHWESKLLLPEILWESSILARELRQRVLELRFPERRIALESGEAPLFGFVRRWGHAPNAVAFVVVLGDVIKPFMLDLYQRYASRADQLDDGPSQFILRHGMADLEGQIARLRTTATAALAAFPAEAKVAREWSAAVAQSLQRWPHDDFFSTVPAPPGPPTHFTALEKPLAIARAAARDPRFHRVAFAWPDRHSPGNAGDGMQLRARQAVHHVNEVWAAEMAAACLHDLGPAAPPEFLEDAARWCYDEIRHCRMGYERLKAWGFRDAEIPLDSFSYDAGAGVDAITRLGIIFYFEATYIHTKKERTTKFAAMGDRLSSHDMDFDWADELIHTAYGKRWLGEFLRQSGDERTLSQVKDAARAAVLQKLAAADEDDKQASAAIFQRMLDKLTAPGSTTAAAS